MLPHSRIISILGFQIPNSAAHSCDHALVSPPSIKQLQRVLLGSIQRFGADPGRSHGAAEDRDRLRRGERSGGIAPRPRNGSGVWEAAAGAPIFLIFSVRLLCIFITMPEAECDKILGIPRNLSYLRVLKDNFGHICQGFTNQIIPGYTFSGYHIFVTLAGALFRFIKGVILVVLSATSGASMWYYLSKLIGRPLVSWIWLEKLKLFQAEIKCWEKLLNYMLI